ncbi:MAG: hypothetical protein WDW38_006474 [Sanguina aurantia]
MSTISLILRATLLALVVLVSLLMTGLGLASRGGVERYSDQPEADAEAAAAVSEGQPFDQEGGDEEAESVPIRDPLLRLVGELVKEASARDVVRLLEQAPTLLQNSDDVQEGLVPDAAPEEEPPTDWRALAEHALQERDMYKMRSEGPLPAFTSNDLVLDPTQSWRVPQPRPPVCVVSELRASKLCPSRDQSSLIGTLLTDAAHTSVGSIMPKFEFRLLD